MGIGLINFPSIRTSMYLEMMYKENLTPSYIVNAKKCKSINDDYIYNEIKNHPQDYWIYTGGGIVKDRLLKEIKLIHMHPGFVPYYKGSTCFYYSLLNTNTISVSALFMTGEIDSGDVILQKTFTNIPAGDIDNFVDPYLRTQTLKEVLLKYKEEGELKGKKQKEEGETYFVIHPVLKHIAILKARK